MFVSSTRFSPTGKRGASTEYGGRGNVDPTRKIYTAGYSTMPARLMWGDGSHTANVTSFLVV